MATKKSTTKKNVPPKGLLTTITKTKQREVLRDLRAVLRKHNLPDKSDILTLNFAGKSCPCSGGKTGVYVQVGNRLVCDCG